MITNQQYIEKYITTNDGEKVPFLWTHGATTEHMGDGLIIYSLVQHMRYKNCVVIGSGGGYIPRILTQSRIDLYKQNIFGGNGDYNWGDIGSTYVVDPCNGIGGQSDIDNEDSFYRKNFYPRFVKETSEEAYYNFFIREDIQIDFGPSDPARHPAKDSSSAVEKSESFVNFGGGKDDSSANLGGGKEDVEIKFGGGKSGSIIGGSRRF